MALYQGSNPISTNVNIAQYTESTELMKHMTVELGDIGQVMLPLNENENKRRYLNGQVILQEQFPRFAQKVKQAISIYPQLACTEAEWQTTRLADPDDQCAKFVIDNIAGTIRLPRIKFLVGNLNLQLMSKGLPINRRLVYKREMETSGNIRRWCNLYSDGWLEQGGQCRYTAAQWINQYITFLKPYKNANYSLTTGYNYNNSNPNTYTYSNVNQLSTTGFYYNWYCASANVAVAYWNTQGYANVPSVNDYELQNDGFSSQYESPYYIQVSTGVEYDIDVTNHITNNNPFSFGMYQRTPAKLNNLSWLLSDNTYKDGTVYTDFYNWLLESRTVDNGIVVKLSTDSDITNYDYVVDTTNTTFRLPITTGDEPASSPRTLYLYFYVGETIQDADLINVGRIIENIANIDTLATYGQQVTTLVPQLESMLNDIDNAESDIDILEARVNVIGGGNYFVPDYTRGVGISSGYVCPSDGIVIVFQELGHPTSAQLWINGVEVASAWYTWRQDYSGIKRPVPLLVGVGDTVTFTNANATFYPFKGR